MNREIAVLRQDRALRIQLGEANQTGAGRYVASPVRRRGQLRTSPIIGLRIESLPVRGMGPRPDRDFVESNFGSQGHGAHDLNAEADGRVD